MRKTKQDKLLETAEDAIRAAETFVARYYHFPRLLNVRKKIETWHLQFDVGVLNEQIINVVLDAGTGKVVRFTKKRTR